MFPQNITIPSEITEFYELYNFISTNSTKQERDYLTTLKLLPEDSFNIENKRLNEINMAMEDLEKFYLKGNNSMPNSIPNNIGSQVYQEVLKPLESFERDKKIIIKSKVYNFGKETNLYFIRNYERSKGKIYPKTPETDLENLRLSRQEIHEWINFDGKWIKSSVNKILINH